MPTRGAHFHDHHAITRLLPRIYAHAHLRSFAPHASRIPKAAAATLGMFAGHANAADAATTFKDMTTNIITASSGFNNLISVVCWIGGAGLGVAGIFKLKNHVDNPGQTPMKDGLVRLGCGGALLAFPFIQQAMQGSIANGSMQRLNAASLQMDSVTVFGQ